MTLRCVLGAALLLAPAVAHAAPDDARRYVGPAEVTGAPEALVQAAPEPTEQSPPSTAQPQPAAAPVRSPPKPTKSFNPRIPKIETQGGVVVQPWVRNTLYTEWYRENYNTVDSDDGFVSLVNRLNLGQDDEDEAGHARHAVSPRLSEHLVHR